MIDARNSRRIGLLGGTFDPIHIAHLHIAACACDDLQLDEVRFIPAGAPPHKPDHRVSSGADRLRMLEIATIGRPAFTPDPADLLDEAPSYTSDLLARIRDEHPDDALWFIIGADSLKDFHTWHEPDRILSLARLAVAERPGWDVAAALADSPLPNIRTHVDTFHSVPINLSATVIRERIATSKPVDWLVPQDVLRFIDDHGLYRNRVSHD